ncbi:F-box/kelch-repeat protein At1g23390-like [Lolium rigidum]|uniref:F-box/kelch-repeat protein At1g23390-like n=1 Tax=Lolium rigidum TaxID=89674 RepID=UPI001F5C7120|nr:F-box/kelch-repeat protein At1g23390-like [Lolium rigidum]
MSVRDDADDDDAQAELPALVASLRLYGDTLESVVERVPAADLAATACVSREWLRAVRSALRRRPRRPLLPWLLVHLHGRRCRRRTCAYDPHSGAWLTVEAPRQPATSSPPPYVRVVHGAHGDRACALTASSLDVAGDPLGTSAPVSLSPPGAWRADPVLAAVGDRLVALGGACQLLAAPEDTGVEVHEGGSWAACGPMPAELRESAAATWLSVAATEQRVYVADRTTGWASWFDPSKRRWGSTRRLRPDAGVSTWGIAPGRAGAGLVLFGAKRCRGDEANATTAKSEVIVQTWEVDGDALDLSPSGAMAMPTEMSGRLFPREDDDDDEVLVSIGVCGNAVGGYVYNAAAPANGAVFYEMQEGSGVVERWEWVPSAPLLPAEPLGRAVVACSPVAVDMLSRRLPLVGP